MNITPPSSPAQVVVFFAICSATSSPFAVLTDESPLLSSPIVTTNVGAIQGKYLTSRNGHQYAAFTSVPYAKPPVNTLRLKSPEPIEPWTKTLNATLTPPPCKQFNAYQSTFSVKGEEDCLYLNVFTRETNPEELKSVLVYIHGGGFRYGDSGNAYWASYFVDEDIVLVTIQYRLGALGFLSLEDSVIPGNFGLKDQSLALQWIRNHIDRFGGDPDQISVFGESAGAVSSHLQMLSQSNDGVIKGGILESGTAYALFTFSPQGAMRKRGREAAKYLGCPVESIAALVCLQGVEADRIASVEKEFLAWASIPSIVFTPVIENSWDPRSFITAEELQAPTKLPWIGGVADNEGLFFSSFMAGEQNKQYLDYFIENINEIFEPTFAIGNRTPIEKLTIKILKSRYFSRFDNEEEVLNNFDRLISELFFICPLIEAVHRSEISPYLYVNSYRPTVTIRTLLGDPRGSSISSHTDELQLLFNQTDQFTRADVSQRAVSKLMVKYWANFAKYQTPDPRVYHRSKWFQSGNEFKYLSISNRPKVEKYFMCHVRDFCESLPFLSYALD